MKSIKNISILIAIFITLSTGFTASPYWTPNKNFELYNKHQAHVTGKIELTLLVGNTPIIRNKSIESNDRFQASINSNEPVYITISTVNKELQFYVINAPGKTKFLSWDPEKTPSLYPQTGPMMGLMGRYNPLGMGATESGLSLKNNITESDIVRK